MGDLALPFSGSEDESRSRFARMHRPFFVLGLVTLVGAIVEVVLNVERYEGYEAAATSSEGLHPASILVVPGALAAVGAFWLTMSWLAEQVGGAPGFAIRPAPPFSPIHAVTEPRLAAPILPR